MAFDEELMQQLMVVFEDELAEQIQLITMHLLALEKLEGAEIATYNADEMLRAAHTIKGSAKGIGLNDIVDVTHQLESIMGALVTNKLNKSEQLINILLNALDRIQDIFNAEKNKKSYDFNLKNLLEDLEATLNNDFFKAEYQHKVKIDIIKPDLSNSVDEKELAIPSLNAADKYKVDNVLADNPKPTEAPEEQEASYTVLAEDISDISIISEDLHISKLQFTQLLTELRHLSNGLSSLSRDVNESIGNDDVKNKQAINSTLLKLSNDAKAMYHRRRPLGLYLNQQVNLLGDSLNKLRLVKFDTLLMPLYRIVRDLSNQQGKQIEFVIDGKDIKIDRYVYQYLNIPLLHIVNNAIDHGIENSTERAEKGKNLKARLSITIIKRGYNIIIYVKDDGRGIDLDKVKQKILSKNFATSDELALLSDKEVMNFIFKAGFSSADIVTTVSGRGVGLDIVRSNLRKIKGSVELKSTLNKGTEFIMTLPATLSSEQGILVKVNEAILAFPSYGVDWVKEFPNHYIKVINGKKVVLDKYKQPVSAFYLAELLNQPTKEASADGLIPMVFISNGLRTIALIVSDIFGEQELIIKAFQYPLIKVPYAIGMSSMADGHLMPVLNIEELIEKSEQANITTTFIENKSADKQTVKKVLIVDDSVTTRTLEENILKRQGFEVSSFVNGLEAWNALQTNPQYDLIISDIEMPLMNGFELVEKIKTNATTASIPVIIVSSLNSEQDKMQGVKLGASAYITKDMLNTDVLLTMIKQLI